MPFFSIVIPVYNRYELAKATILSVLSQTFRDYEIVVVNDGSNDGTLQYLQQEFSESKNLRIISQLNSERGAARNKGFNNSTGTYVVFLDSDDLLFSNHLITLYENIVEQNSPPFIATKFNFIRSNKIVSSSIQKIPRGYYDYKLFLDGNPLACNICVKRENPKLYLFEEDRSYAVLEDWLFMIQNFKEEKLYLIDTETLSMVDHENRSMRGDHELLIRKTFLAVNWIEEKVSLIEPEKNQLIAHANYFCAIHSYLAGNTFNCIKYLSSATKLQGLKFSYCLLFLKSILGYQFISKLKS